MWRFRAVERWRWKNGRIMKMRSMLRGDWGVKGWEDSV